MRLGPWWIACLLLGACSRARDLDRGAWTPGTAWVAADRDGDALVELDEDLFVLGRHVLESPLLLRAGGGRVWIVHAPAGAPGPPQALRPWGATGAGAARAVGAVLDLEVDGRGRALVLEEVGGERSLTRHDVRAAPCDLEVPAGAVALALAPTGPAVALGRSGWAERDPTGRWRVRSGLEGAAVLDLAARPQGGWWSVEEVPGEAGCVLVTRDGSGVPLRARAVGDVHALARRAAGPWAWAWDERDLAPPEGPALMLGAAGARAAVGDARGGVVLAAGGALLRLTSEGRGAPGQGGFARLVDLERLGPGP